MKKFLLFFLVIVVLLATVWALQPFKISNQWYFLFPAGVAEKQIYQFELPSKAVDISKVSITGPDGTLPEIASLSFYVNDINVEKIVSHFLKQCELLGYGVLSDDTSEPDTICRSGDGATYTTVNLSWKCSGASCKYFFSVNSI